VRAEVFSKMRTLKTYSRLTLIISILFGIVLPLVFGGKGILLLAFLFTIVLLVYAIILSVWVFLITGRKNLRRRLNEGIPNKWGYSLAVSFPPVPRPNISSCTCYF